jgi:hypothetical protein
MRESPLLFSADAGRAWRRKGKAADTAAFFFGIPYFVNDAVSRHST